MGVSYEQDIVAWANEQANLIRAGRFDLLDLEHIAEEIESVGKSEKRELASRMAVLLAHLLKWQYQPVRRGSSWEKTIRVQRKEIAYEIKNTPSLKPLLSNAEWIDLIWGRAVSIAMDETGLDTFPENCPWTPEQILNIKFYPEGAASSEGE